MELLLMAKRRRPEPVETARVDTAYAPRPGDAYAWLWPIHGLVTWGEAISIRNRARKEAPDGKIGRAPHSPVGLSAGPA